MVRFFNRRSYVLFCSYAFYIVKILFIAYIKRLRAFVFVLRDVPVFFCVLWREPELDLIDCSHRKEPIESHLCLKWGNHNGDSDVWYRENNLVCSKTSQKSRTAQKCVRNNEEYRCQKDFFCENASTIWWCIGHSSLVEWYQILRHKTESLIFLLSRSSPTSQHTPNVRITPLT